MMFKKKNDLRHFQEVNHTNNILAQEGYTLGIKRVPPFSRTMFVDRRRSLIFAILTFPEEIRSSFKNYKSPSIFNKILEQTNRSTFKQALEDKARSGWPQKGKIFTDYKERTQTSVGPFSLL